MRLIVKPLTKNTELGEHSLLTCHLDVEKGLPMYGLNSLAYKVLIEVIRKAAPTTTTQVSEGAEGVAMEWFTFILNKIFAISEINPIYPKDLDRNKRIKAVDMVWAINNLPSETYLQALASWSGTVYRSLGKTTPNGRIEFIVCHPFLNFGDDVTENIQYYCESWEGDEHMKCHVTCGGRFVLLNWMGEILARAMNIAGKICSEHGLKRITSKDMLSGLNWARLNLLPATPFSLHGQVNKNKKRKRICDDETIIECDYDSKNNFYIPNDLLERHIFPSLPLKSLLRFNCVCKKWRQIISSSCFRCSLQTQKNPTTVSIGIYNSLYKPTHYNIVSECDGLEMVMVDTILYKGRHSYLYGSCSGILCFAIPIGREKCRFIIGNPVTNQWHILPPTIYPHSNGSHRLGPGLAVNASTNPPSYKLVLLAFTYSSCFLQVFSSESWEWKPLPANSYTGIQDAMQLERFWYSLYIDGVLYYTAADSTTKNRLIWLDIEKNMIGTISLPAYNEWTPRAIGSLVKLDGRKRLTCSINADGQRVETYELVDKNEWEILLSVNVTGQYFRPFPYYGGEILIIWKDEEIFSYNLSTEQWTLIAKDKYQGISGYNFFPYYMSVLPLPEMKALEDAQRKASRRQGKKPIKIRKPRKM